MLVASDLERKATRNHILFRAEITEDQLQIAAATYRNPNELAILTAHFVTKFN